MPKQEIGFDLILNENLKLRWLKLKQVQVVVEVQGDADPLMLQKIYDHVRDDFLSERKKLNDTIRTYNTNLDKTPKKRQELYSHFQKNMDGRVKSITDMLQNEVNRFCQEEAKRAETAEASVKSGTMRAIVRCGWSAIKIVKDSVEAVGAGLTGVGTPMGLKKIVDIAMDVKELFEDLVGQIRDEKKQRSLVKGHLDQIKKLKQDRDLKESSVKVLEDSIKLYADKLDRIDVQARNASRGLNGLLQEVSSLDGVEKEKVALAEKGVDQLLKEIVKLSTGLRSGHEFLKKARLQLATARKAAKKDGWFSLDFFGQLNNWFKDVNDLFDNFSLLVLDKIIKKFGEN
jgi:hypothetical protein